jgi:hypothetical protein
MWNFVLGPACSTVLTLHNKRKAKARWRRKGIENFLGEVQGREAAAKAVGSGRKVK